MSQVLSGLMGVCMGDALGVPVEFTSRAQRSQAPVTAMLGYGSHHQPPGTWSDDSSLTFCLAESMCEGFSLEAIAQSFCRWYSEGYWTPHGQVFDIGYTTSTAIRRLKQGVPPAAAGSTDEKSNGNGSLMRILPLAYYHKTLNFSELIQRVHDCSSITHGHPRSQIACGLYISITVCLLQGLNKESAYLQGIENMQEIYAQPEYASEISLFKKICNGEISTLPIDAIQSSGYVIATLEAALWCFLTTATFTDAVLKAVNLGEDTDTVGAVTGGLAGIYYGVENIPAAWSEQIVRKDDIIGLAMRLDAAVYS